MNRELHNDGIESKEIAVGNKYVSFAITMQEIKESTL